jgi:hypothetical protein
MYYSYVEIEYVATSLSPARTDLTFKLLGELLGYGRAVKRQPPWSVGKVPYERKEQVGAKNL